MRQRVLLAVNREFPLLNLDKRRMWSTVLRLLFRSQGVSLRFRFAKSERIRERFRQSIARSAFRFNYLLDTH